MYGMPQSSQKFGTFPLSHQISTAAESTIGRLQRVRCNSYSKVRDVMLGRGKGGVGGNGCKYRRSGGQSHRGPSINDVTL